MGGSKSGEGMVNDLSVSHRRPRGKECRLFPRAHILLFVVRTVAFRRQRQRCPKSVHGRVDRDADLPLPTSSLFCLSSLADAFVPHIVCGFKRSH